MPLIIAPSNVDLKVVKILLDEKTKKHLENLGITVSSSLKILSKSGSTLICIVKGSRLALDSFISNKILVA